MQHVKAISKKPVHAQDIPVSAKLQFVIAVLAAFTPLIVAKDTDPAS